MNYAAVFVAIIICAVAAPIDESKNAVILRNESKIIGVDGYYFEWVRYISQMCRLINILNSFPLRCLIDSFKTSDGISRNEEGRLKTAENGAMYIYVYGTYSYKYDGIIYIVDYVADENGYRIEEPICKKKKSAYIPKPNEQIEISVN